MKISEELRLATLGAGGTWTPETQQEESNTHTTPSHAETHPILPNEVPTGTDVPTNCGGNDCFGYE